MQIANSSITKRKESIIKPQQYFPTDLLPEVEPVPFRQRGNSWNRSDLKGSRLAIDRILLRVVHAAHGQFRMQQKRLRVSAT